jgi:Ca-activated chloride channel homolog
MFNFHSSLHVPSKISHPFARNFEGSSVFKQISALIHPLVPFLMTPLRFLICFLITLLATLPTSQAAPEPARVIIVFDASGSMAAQLDGRAKIDIAKEVVSNIVAGIDPAVELGLVAYGHRRKGDCEDIELLVPPGPGTSGAVLSAVQAIQPLGKTPLTAAVIQAAGYLRYTESKASVILVSDGEETCDQDPCRAAGELEAAGLDFTCHVVGFALGAAQTGGLECLAKQTGGLYLPANSAADLLNALQEAVKQVMTPAEVLVIEPKLASGGPVIDGVSFTLSTPQETLVAQGGGGRWNYELPQPGQYIVMAERSGKTIRLEVEVATGETRTVEAIFTETGLKATAYDKPNGTAYQSGVVWTLYGAADAAGARQQVGFSYEAAPFIRVDPGNYTLVAERGSAKAEIAVMVGDGPPTDVYAVLGSGTLKLSAVSKAGEAPISKDLAWDILGQPDVEGDRKSVSYSYEAQPSLTMPAGQFLVKVTQGNAFGVAPVEIKAGEVTEVVISLESGTIKAVALLQEGGEPIGKDLVWDVLGMPDLEGKRTSIGYSYEAQPTLTLPAGPCLVTVTHGSAKASVEVVVTAGQTQSLAIVLGAGKLKLSALPAAGASPLSSEVAWDVLGAPNLEGNRASVGYSYESEPTLSLPAGAYTVTTTWGAAKTSTEVVVEPGKLATYAVVMNVGTAKVHAVMAPGGEPISADNLAWTVLGAPNLEGNRPDVTYSYQENPLFRLSAGNYLVKVTRGAAVAEAELVIQPNQQSTLTLVLNAGVLKVSSSGEGSWTVYRVPAEAEGALQDLTYSYDAAATFYLPAGKVLVRRTKGETKTDKEVTIEAGKLTELGF